MENTDQLARLGLFDARVPRYTSYPTAPNFADNVTGETYHQWLAALTPGTRVSLYLHIPFCRRLCWFCACRTQGTSTLAPVRAYVETLKAELALLRAGLPAGVEIGEVHWGGGTPTLLPQDVILDLAAAVRAVAPEAEDMRFAVEIDPNEIDADRLDALAQAGLRRASVGVQDFAPAIQAVIGRAQSFEVTRDAVEGLRQRGVDSLNVDLLYGLPKQSVASVSDSLQKVLSLNPDRIALFGYAHVPWMARRQVMIPTEDLPDPHKRLELFETARRLLLWDGYVEIGIDHFARPTDTLAIAAQKGTLRRNFQGYTDDACAVQIGVGASSISRFPQGYAQNHSTTKDYVADVRARQLPIKRGHVFTPQDHQRGKIIEDLMCRFEADVADHTLRETAQAQFGNMVRISGTHVQITPEGRPLTRIIAQHFDAYALSEAGHSSAI